MFRAFAYKQVVRIGKRLERRDWEGKAGLEGWGDREGGHGRAQGGLEFDWTWAAGKIPTGKDKENWPAGINKVGHTRLPNAEG